MLGANSTGHVAQTVHVMELIEPIPIDERQDLMMVSDDSSSTLAATLMSEGAPHG